MRLIIALLSFWSSCLLASPATVTELTIESSSHRLPGLIYQARGAGPHPTVILLHGYPGNEKNLDVAQSLRRLGWNAVFFNYRGAWGAEGEFSFRNSEQDVQAVIKYLQSNAAALKVDPRKISLIGHSMGGHMAIAGLLDNQDVRCAVSYDGVNLGANGRGFFSDPETSALWRGYSDTLFMLAGWSGEKAVKEITDFGEQLDLRNRVQAVNGRSVLLVSADTEVVPEKLHILPLFDALKGTKSSQVTYHLIDDDHSFSNTRSALIETTHAFLHDHCR